MLSGYRTLLSSAVVIVTAAYQAVGADNPRELAVATVTILAGAAAAFFRYKATRVFGQANHGE